MVLDTLVTMFSRYCSEAYTVEKCEVETPEGQTNVYPDLKYRQDKVSLKKINNAVGIQESADKVADLLTRMCLNAAVQQGDDILVNINS